MNFISYVNFIKGCNCIVVEQSMVDKKEINENCFAGDART
jgi:hypothetical protein